MAHDRIKCSSESGEKRQKPSCLLAPSEPSFQSLQPDSPGNQEGQMRDSVLSCGYRGN